MSEDRMVIRPKILVPDLSEFGVEDFGEGYKKLSRLERQVVWQSMMEITFQLVAGHEIRGRTFHRLLTALTNAFPEMEVDESFFDRFVPNLGGGSDRSGARKSAPKSPGNEAANRMTTARDSSAGVVDESGESERDVSRDQNRPAASGPGGGPAFASPKGTSEFSGLLG